MPLNVQPIKPIHADGTIMLEFHFWIFFFPLYHQYPLQTLTFHCCWIEGCNLAKTCPASCIFFLLYSLAIICCWDVTLKPNPLYPKRMGPKPCPKIVVELFTSNLNCCNKQCIIEPSFIFFLNILPSCFLQWGKCMFNLFWFLLFSFFCFLLLDFINNFFI